MAKFVSADRPTANPPSCDDLGLSSPGPHEASAFRKREGSRGLKKPSEADKSVVSVDQAGGRGGDRLRDLVLQAERKGGSDSRRNW